MQSLQRLSVVLASSGDPWPYADWPGPDDPFVSRVLHLLPPYPGLRETTADVVLLRCEDPAVTFPGLVDELGSRDVPVIVVSSRRDVQAVVAAFRAGAGYLVEGDYCDQMLSHAAQAAFAGHTYLSPSASDALREEARRMAEADDEMTRLRGLLSPRERQIMELLSTGLLAQEIALRLSLTEKTIRNNLSNIYAKLDVRGGTEAVLRWLGAASGGSQGALAR
ncbi:LuxR C-terminal-related transcriptional regulator [Streptomyces sp. NPDC019531]|uniref:LuxR C-terminal-related transcriptional regulator n=1 Tax=Streptomyces sp. NPDC019531 TaxID=3365062 RepID=UPI00384D985E